VKSPRIRTAARWALVFGCAALIVLWLWSARHFAYWTYPRGLIFITRGQLELWYYPASDFGGSASIWAHTGPHPSFSWSWWFHGTQTKTGNVILAVPLWLFELILLVPLIRPWRFTRARRRIRRGLCTGCGYDRRGISEQRECPECGALPPPVVTPPVCG
jgi:hypothetical protein